MKSAAQEECDHLNAEWTGVTKYVSPLLYSWECPDCGFEWLQRSKDTLGEPHIKGKEPVEYADEGYIRAPYIPAFNGAIQPRSMPVGTIFYLEYMKETNPELYGETVIEAPDMQADNPDVNITVHGEPNVKVETLPPDAMKLLNICIHGAITEKMVVDVYPAEVTRYLEQHDYWQKSYSSIFQLGGPNGEPGHVREHNGWHWAEEHFISLQPYESWHDVVRKIAEAERRGEIEVMLQIKMGLDTEEFERFLYGGH